MKLLQQGEISIVFTSSEADRVADCIGTVIPQATERQHIGNEVNAAMILARADVINAHGAVGLSIG